MPSKQRTELDPCLEYNDSQTHVRCTTCASAYPNSSANKWIQYKSRIGHLNSSEHSDAVEEIERRARNRQILQEEHDALVQSQIRTAPQLKQPQISSQIPLTARSVPVDSDFWSQVSNNDFVLDPVDNPEAHLKQQVLDEFRSWDSNIGQDFLGNVMSDLNINDAEAGDDIELLEILGITDAIENSSDDLLASADWFPYPSKIFFLLDTVDNLPRIRISESVMRMIIWILQQVGVKNVPSLKKLRESQKELREKSGSGIPTIPCRSPQGNIFYMNDIRSLVAKDWADPNVRPHIHLYPEIPSDGISEVFHGEKWRFEMDRRTLSPMYDLNGTHYFIDELAQLQDGRLVIPLQWMTFKKKVVANALSVEINELGVATVVNDNPTLIDATKLEKNLLELEDLDLMPRSWDAPSVAKGYPLAMPNPDREIAAGEPLYSSYVDIFTDDVSGNKSKAWNKHLNTYFKHRNLPREILSRECNIHFISTSQHASSNEQFHSLKKVIESTHQNPVRVRDACTGKTVRFRIHGHAGTSDNPAQSDQCSHAGGRACYNCRKCKVGGEKKMLKTDSGYMALFKKGVPRMKEDTLLELRNQVNWACTNGTITRIEEMQTKSGVKDEFTQYWIRELIQQYKAKVFEAPDRPKSEIVGELKEFVNEHEEEVYNAFLLLPGFDPAQDTPVEILHTILLGIVKYIWYLTHSNWNSAQKALYALRLQSTDQNGLSIQAIRANYIMQYANSLIGRQLKTIQQTSIFHIYDLVDEDILHVWKSVGELSALLWYPVIQNMDLYLEDIRIAVQNVLDSFSIIDPKKIADKIKMHLLTHLDDDIQRFGPILGVITEGYEGWNAIFRACSVLSNHLAPSRDIALQLADQEGLKQRLSNGWWYSQVTGEWEQSSSNVQSFVKSQPILQRLLGHNDTCSKLQPGTIRLKPMNRAKDGRERATETLGNTKASISLNQGEFDMQSRWLVGTEFVSKSGDKCSLGSWVAMASPIHSSPVIGRIDAILEETGIVSPSAVKRIAVVELFQLSSDRHAIFNMPILNRRHGEEEFLVVLIQDVMFDFNAQHDCRLAQCEASGLRPQQQERQESDIQESFIEHKALDIYIINLHSFHNAHLVRELLPPSLTQPIPLFTGLAREEKLKEFAQNFRNLKEKSEAEAAEKRAKKRKE